MKRLLLSIAIVIFAGAISLRGQGQQTVGSFVFVVSSDPASCTLGNLYWNTTSNALLICSALNTLQSVTPALSGTTGSIGGSLLSLGSSSSGTASISGATVGMVCVAQASDGTDMGALGVVVACTVTSAGTVTVRLIGLVAVTPAAKTYGVRVIP